MNIFSKYVDERDHAYCKKVGEIEDRECTVRTNENIVPKKGFSHSKPTLIPVFVSIEDMETETPPNRLIKRNEVKMVQYQRPNKLETTNYRSKAAR